MRKFAVLGMLALVGSFDRALAQPAFTVTSSSVSFSQTVNGAAPAPQIVTVGSTGAPISFAVSITYNQGQNWLAVAPGSAITPNASLTLTANGAGLPTGTYTAQVIVSSPGINSQAISVTLTVGSGSLGFAGSLAHLASAGLRK